MFFVQLVYNFRYVNRIFRYFLNRTGRNSDFANLFPFPNRILGWSMSGLILFIVAVALLGVAIYSLVSYLKERRASQLPVHKKKK